MLYSVSIYLFTQLLVLLLFLMDHFSCFFHFTLSLICFHIFLRKFSFFVFSFTTFFLLFSLNLSVLILVCLHLFLRNLFLLCFYLFLWELIFVCLILCDFVFLCFYLFYEIFYSHAFIPNHALYYIPIWKKLTYLLGTINVE